MTPVLADTLTPDALVTSLEAGKFYSSSGVKLQSITFKDNKLTVKVAAEADQKYQIEFIGTRRNFDQSSRPAVEDETKAAGITRVYSSDIGSVLKTVNGTTASYTLDGTEPDSLHSPEAGADSITISQSGLLRESPGRRTIE